MARSAEYRTDWGLTIHPVDNGVPVAQILDDIRRGGCHPLVSAKSKLDNRHCVEDRQVAVCRSNGRCEFSVRVVRPAWKKMRFEVITKRKE